MKNLLLLVVCSYLLTACSTPEKKEDDSAKKTDDMTSLYEKNLAVIKSAIASFENKDIEGWAANVADSVVWNSPSYGDTVTTKAHWKEVLTAYLTNWNDLKLTKTNFLPGVDSTTHQPDGSVRFYGVWVGTSKSGVQTSSKFYGSYDLNKDNKVIFADEYFDVGGLLAAMNPKK
jgi:hypothetical protein